MSCSQKILMKNSSDEFITCASFSAQLESHISVINASEQPKRIWIRFLVEFIKKFLSVYGKRNSELLESNSCVAKK